MNKLTVGQIFQVLIIAKKEHKENVIQSAENEDTSHYGESFVNCLVIEDFLTSCMTEVEITSKVLDVIVPIISRNNI